MARKANAQRVHAGYGELRVPHIDTTLKPEDDTINGLPGVFFEGVLTLNPPRLAHDLGRPIPHIRQLYIPGEDGNPRYVLSRTGHGTADDRDVSFVLSSLPLGVTSEAEPLLVCGPYKTIGEYSEVKLGGELLWRAGVGGLNQHLVRSEIIREAGGLPQGQLPHRPRPGVREQ